MIASGGGVAVTQTVHGALGWSQSPCQSTTSAQWYFANGSSAASNVLYVSLLNPTSTPVVVDLSFLTPSGMVHPINYQGIVLPAGQVAVENVSSEVQNVGDHQHRRGDADRPRGRVGGAGARRPGRDLGRALARPGRALAPAALDDPPGPGGARRLLRGRHLQPGPGHRDGDGGLPAALGPAGTADRQDPARHDLGARHQRPDAHPRRRDLCHHHRRHRGSRRRRGAHREPAGGSGDAPGRHRAGRGRADHPVADGPVGGATARHGRQPRRERRRSRLPRAGQHLGGHRAVHRLRRHGCRAPTCWRRGRSPPAP